jgi:hypothetical protein
MGTSLNGLTPAATYQGLIKFGNNSAISATLRYLSDGLGNDLPISVASSSVGINTITNNGLFNIKGTGTSSSTTNFIIQNSSNIELARLYDNGNLYLGSATTNANFLNITKYGIPVIRLRNTNLQDTGGPDGTEIMGVTGSFSADSDSYGGIKLLTQTNWLSSQLGFYVGGYTGTPVRKMTLRNDGSLYIGTGTPTASTKLQVIGLGATSATTNILSQNSSNTQLFKVLDDGTIEAGGATATQFKVMNTSGLSIARDGSFDANIRIREFGTGGPVFKMNGNSTPNFKFLDGSNFQCIASDANWTGTGYLTAKNTSAALQTDSTTTGWLPPRMTDAQVRAIVNPAVALTCYNTDLDCPVFYSTLGWRKISHSVM